MNKIILHTVSLPATADRLFDMYLDPVIHGAIAGGTVTISTREPSAGPEKGGKASCRRSFGTISR